MEMELKTKDLRHMWFKFENPLQRDCALSVIHEKVFFGGAISRCFAFLRGKILRNEHEYTDWIYNISKEFKRLEFDK